MDTREPAVAVVGASGAVGAQIVELILERGFGHRELKLFGTESSSAESLSGVDETLLVEPLSLPSDLSGFDIVFLSVPASVAENIIAANPGPLLIDLSASSRAHASIPIVAPGLVSREQLQSMRGSRVIAPAHPAAAAIAACLSAINIHGGAVSASLIVGASAGGRRQITRLVEQTTELLSARLDLQEEEVQRGFNLFMRENERSLASAIAAQARALLSDPPAIRLSVAVAPIVHGAALTIEIPAAAEMGEWIDRLGKAPGIILAEEGAPLGVIDAVGQEAVMISAELSETGLTLWCVFDNARLAALSALWIAETMSPAGSKLT
jgi:aspartate-semialdehyde dehydrogenase